MEWFRRWLHAHKDPLLVWNFQKTFGVEKVRIIGFFCRKNQEGSGPMAQRLFIHACFWALPPMCTKYLLLLRDTMRVTLPQNIQGGMI